MQNPMMNIHSFNQSNLSLLDDVLQNFTNQLPTPHSKADFVRHICLLMRNCRQMEDELEQISPEETDRIIFQD